ncbi:MAG: hypothetical protein ACYC6A_11235 [Armatimonadota bacterium]
MKKGLAITLAILVLLGAAVFWGGKMWVRKRLDREMTKQLQKSVRPFVENPENLQLENKQDVQITRDTVRMPEVEVTGKDLQLPHDIQAKSARVVVRDVEVDTKTKKVSSVGEGSYAITLSAEDLTKVLRQQNTMKIHDLLVLPDTTTVTLSRQDGITLAGEGTEEASSKRLPFTLRGKLVPDASGKLAFQIADSTRGGEAVGVAGESHALPAGSLLPPHLESGRVREVVIEDGAITFKGSFDGAQLLQHR